MLESIKNHDGVLNIYLYGSRVYGTANNNSDYDYIVVVDNQNTLEKLALTKGENEDFSFYTKEQFQEQINLHEISVLECLFLPDDKVVKKTVDFPFTLELDKLRHAVSQKSSNSWVKAKKKFIVEEDYAPYIGQKSAWHSLRILDFGCQIAKSGKITNYQETNGLLPVILNLNSWQDLDENLRAINRAKNTEFKKLAPKALVDSEPVPKKLKLG